MSRSKNSRKGCYPRHKRTDPWDLCNKFAKTSNKKSYKRYMIEVEIQIYHNLHDIDKMAKNTWIHYKG
ncbi:MAG: hypothetical protein GF364_00560 [Candidatus Lokiarchaeota archaeon]|nr:hypothetical protein [Candidatus Lokiarchaeota archaeon]